MRNRLTIGVATMFLSACSEDPRPRDPAEHCGLPTVASLGPGDPAAAQWWRPGPLDVGSTLPWPECPPLDEATASSSDEPRITFPATGEDVAEGRWPVVIFGHANSVSVCNPTDRYRSLHEQWASWGWVVYSVDASAENCTTYSVENMRSRIARHRTALEDLRARNADPSSPFFERLDLGSVVAAGHSRGGATAIVLVSETEDYVGAISLQGGNPARFQLGTPFVSRPVIGITGELDTDLEFPHVDLTEELLRGPYSWHTLRRGNHSFTADGLPIREEDDRAQVLSREAQIELTKYLTTAFLAGNFGVWNGSAIAVQPAAAAVLLSHDADDVASATLGGEGFWSRWSLGPEHPAVWIDRFDSRAIGLEDDAGTRADATLNDLGGANICEGLARCEEVWTYAADAEEVPVAGVRLASSLLLVAGDGAGVFRTIVDREIPAGWRLHARVRHEVGGEADFDVVLGHEDDTRRVSADEAVGPGRLSDRFVQLDVAIGLEELEEVAFEVRSGSLYIDDLRLVAP